MPGFVSVPGPCPGRGRGRRDRQDRPRRQLVGQEAVEDDELVLVEPRQRRPVLAVAEVELRVGQEAQGGLEVRVRLAGEQDLALLLGRHDGPGPVVDAERVRRRGARALRVDQPHLDDGRRVLRVVDVVDRDVGPALRVEVRVRESRSRPSREQLELAVGELEAEVGDRDERAVRQAARRGADGQRDDRLVGGVAAHPQDPDRRLERSRRRRRQRGVGRDQDLRVARARREGRREPQASARLPMSRWA